MSADRDQYQFDAIYMLDWSAAGKPTFGKDSIWLKGTDMPEPVNIGTRAKVWRWFTKTATLAQRNGHRILIGFDFAFAYPVGTAEALGRHEGDSRNPWQYSWDQITDLIEDSEDNSNNRFAVGATLNQRIARWANTDQGPFWGHPPGEKYLDLEPLLPAKKPNGNHGLSQWRVIEQHEMLKGCQPGWKLCYAGSVGGQALVGIAGLNRLRRGGPKFSVWPFEEPTEAVTVAEVYPSLWPLVTNQHAVKDANQVAEIIARLSLIHEEQGSLVGIMDRKKLPFEAITEEGWVLGVPPKRQPST